MRDFANTRKAIQFELAASEDSIKLEKSSSCDLPAMSVEDLDKMNEDDAYREYLEMNKSTEERARIINGLNENGDMMIIALTESIPEGLATHEKPQTMNGRWHTWLPPHILDAIADGNVWADAYMSRAAAVETLKRTFDSANLTYNVDTTEADVFFSNITTPGEGVYGRGLSVASVLRRAVYTGLTPGEAARLTAEEIVGVLLRVWK